MPQMTDQAPQVPTRRPDDDQMDSWPAQVLAQAVRAVAGPDAQPREGQAALSADVAATMASVRLRDLPTDAADHLAAIGPTGVGKSLGYLAPAMARAAAYGERTVISTESLTLQDQIVRKDAPTVAAACEQITGHTPTIAVHKGWSNYVCVKALLEQTDAVDLHEVQRRGTSPLTVWAATRLLDDPESATRSAFDGRVTNDEWDQISVSAAECSRDSCPFADQCAAVAARNSAAVADIVVTNHALLGVQTAHGVPAVLGSTTLGKFAHLVIDEAHALPGIVRGQGAHELSSRKLLSFARSVANLFDEGHPASVRLLRAAEVAAGMIDADVTAVVGRKRDAVRLGEGATGLDEATIAAIEAVLDSAKHLLASVRQPVASVERRVLRLRGRRQQLVTALSETTTHEPDVARWVEQPADPGGVASIKSSPVDVGGMLNARLYSGSPGPKPASPGGANEHGADEVPQVDWAAEASPVSVTAVSATLPRGFCAAAGLSTRPESYPSPFEPSYADSALFVPALDDGEAEPLLNDWGRFDVTRHRAWAADQVVDLVIANGGRALVLAATKTAGLEYVAALRSRFTDAPVYSQWDGAGVGSLVARWRDETASVLVGTRSLMTGVDAPGQTCSLVIVDRPARAAGNPVDDARVDSIATRQEISNFVASEQVYVADAVLLLDQAVGRLIRSVSDRGMVAVLDPRLTRESGAFKYQRATRRLYQEPLRKFGTKLNDTSDATRWLRARR